MIAVAATGFFTAFSLILAIGAQNAFVLRQGLLKQHVFALCLLCAVSDAFLIAAGVIGFGALVARFPAFPTIMALLGAGFLIFYGATRFLEAYKGGYAMAIAGKPMNLRATLVAGLAFTWLNPHVYLDTLGLVGAVSTQYADPLEKTVFAIAATSASFVFFFSLGYGARLLAPIMQSARSWRILDILIGAIMWTLAIKLLLGVVG